MKINAPGLAIIKTFEGLRLKSYLCPAGKLTIGYGHTGADVKAGAVINAAQAEALLRGDLASCEAGVASLVKVPVSDNEFSALVCFAFNIGLGNLQSSTLLKNLNAGDRAAAGEQFLRWTKAAGKELPGLVARRRAERQLFLTPAETVQRAA